MKYVVSAILFVSLFVLTLVVLSEPAWCVTASRLSSDVTWSIHLNDSDSAPIQTGSGSEITINSDIIYSPESSELIAALDGISFSFEGIPSSGALEIKLVLNVRGNTFEPVRGKDCSFNLSVIPYVDGYESHSAPVSVSITIPRNAGLDYLLGLSDLNGYNDLAFASYSDGAIKPERVSSTAQVQGIIVVIDTPTTIVGGKSTDLGIPASVENSTWYKVKKLFE